MNNFNYLQSLYADNKLVSVDDKTIKYNINEELYVNEISNNIIKFDNQYIILCSDISNNPIETKLTNDYIDDETINIIKIKDLSLNLYDINYKINDLSYNTDININNLKIYTDLQNYDLSLNLNNKINDISNNLYDLSYNTDININNLKIYTDLQNYDLSLNLNNKINDISNNLYDLSHNTDILIYDLKIYSDLKNYDLSLNLNNKINDISNNLYDLSHNTEILLNDLKIYTDLKNYDLSLNLNNKINDISNNLYDLSYNTDININNLKIYTDLQNYDLSLNLNNKINDISNNLYDLSHNTDILIYDLKIYSDLKNYDLSLNLNNKINDISNNLYDLSHNTEFLLNDLKVYSDLKNYDLSLNLNNKINDISNNLYDLSYNTEFLLNDLKVYSDLKNYDLSLNLNNKIIDVSNNIILYTDSYFYKKYYYDLSFNFLNNKFLDFYNKIYIDNLISLYYTKVQIDNILTSYYTSTQIQNLYFDKNYINTNIYLKSQTFSQTEINNKINDVSNNIALYTYSKAYLDNKFLDYLTSIQTSNLYYNKTYIDNLISLYYTKVQIDNILLNYITSSSLSITLNNYYLKTQTFSQTEINNLLSSYVLNTTFNNTLVNYYLKSQTFSQTEINNLLSSYVLNSFLTGNYTNNTDLTTLLNNKVNLSTYNTDIGNINTNLTNINNKFFTPISSGNLKKSFFEYADLTTTKYIFFSQNGTNQYQTINFIDNNTLQASKLINNSIGQTQLDTTFYNNSLYCYNTFVDQSTGALSLASLNPPSSQGSFYLSAIRGPVLTQINWQSSSNLFNIYQTFQSNGNTSFLELQNTATINNTIPITNEYMCSHSSNSNFLISMGGNYSTSLFGSVYGYLYCKMSDLRIFNNNTGNINTALLFRNNEIYCYRDLVLNNYKITNIGLTNNTKLFNTPTDRYTELILDKNYTPVSGQSDHILIKLKNNSNPDHVFSCGFNSSGIFDNLYNYNYPYGFIYSQEDMTMFCKNRYTNTIHAFMSATGAGTNADTPIINVFRNMNLNNWKLLNIDTVRTNFITSNTNSTIQFNTKIASNQGIIYGANTDANNWNINNVNQIFTNYIGTNNIGKVMMYANLDLNGYSLLNYSGGGGSSTVNGPFTVNQGGYLTQVFSGNNYASNPGYYYYNNAVVGGFYTNSSNESAHVVGNGDFLQLINTFDNLGVLFSDEDQNFASSYQSYINSSGNLIVSSSKKLKYSIREKKNKNYLERLKKVKVYSYAMRCNIDNNKEYNEKKLNRMIYKNKKLNIGLIADEISDIFENMTDKEKLINLDDDNINDYNELIKDKKPTINDDEYLKEKNNKPHTSINYNVVCCYLIKCFHEQITINEKLDDENKKLKDRIDDLEYKINLLLKLNII